MSQIKVTPWQADFHGIFAAQRHQTYTQTYTTDLYYRLVELNRVFNLIMWKGAPKCLSNSTVLSQTYIA